MKASNDTSRPRIKLPLKSHDWVIEFLGLAFLIILIILPILYHNDLPERIPTHFNAAGTPDDYGSRSTLWLLPGTGLLLYLVMTAVSAFPHIFNFAVKITPDNAAIQYRLATRMIRILKAVVLSMFAFISFMTIRTATGSSQGLGKVFLPVFLILTFGVVVIYLVLSLNNRDHA